MKEDSNFPVAWEDTAAVAYQPEGAATGGSVGNRKFGSVSADRDQRGRFAAGNKGKPRGAKSRATKLAVELLESGIQDVANVVVEAARKGDLAAARIVLDKLVPAAKERCVELPDLPDTSTASGVNAAQQRVLEAVAIGALTPGEANTLSAILEQRRKAIETLELERRLVALEERTK